jgi:hypothetical protein
MGFWQGVLVALPRTASPSSTALAMAKLIELELDEGDTRASVSDWKSGGLAVMVR